MSYSYSYLAARCEVDELQEALLAEWPTLELVEPDAGVCLMGQRVRVGRTPLRLPEGRSSERRQAPVPGWRLGSGCRHLVDHVRRQ